MKRLLFGLSIIVILMVGCTSATSTPVQSSPSEPKAIDSSYIHVWKDVNGCEYIVYSQTSYPSGLGAGGITPRNNHAGEQICNEGDSQ